MMRTRSYLNSDETLDSTLILFGSPSDRVNPEIWASFVRQRAGSTEYVMLFPTFKAQSEKERRLFAPVAVFQ